jgi:hypothetical protein
MRSRLFLGLKVSQDQKEALKESSLSFTYLNDKIYCGFIVDSKSSLNDLETLERELLKIVQPQFYGQRVPRPVLFSELLFG